MKKKYFIHVLLLLSFFVGFFVNEASSANILVLFPIATKSHKNIFDPLIVGLADRGHNITVVAALKLATPLENVREISPLPFDGDFGGFSNDQFEKRKEGKLNFIINYNSTFVRVGCTKLFENTEIKQLIKVGPGTFDVIIVNMFMNPCAIGIVHELQAPHIYLVTMPAMNFQVQKVGLYFPPSFVPSSFAAFGEKMTFRERVVNFVIEYSMVFFAKYYWDEPVSKTYQQHLGDHIPLISKIDKNVSLILMNSHFSVTYPRPLLPDVVEIGGMSTRPAKPLPKDLEDFVNSAENGVIYFSFGSIVKTKDMPAELRRKFLNVFSRLKQKVLWKWDSEVGADVPENVKLSKWLPQQDVLGHPNTRLFISHGGLLSTQEAIYHGVPIIGFPIFGDQDLNMIQAEKAGFAINLEINELTEEILENAINRGLTNSRISSRVKELSAIFKDRIHTPLQTAVYWVEYIIRHKGAPHLRSAARNLNFFAYHSIDVLIFLFCAIIVVLWLSKYILFSIACKLRKYFQQQLAKSAKKFKNS